MNTADADRAGPAAADGLPVLHAVRLAGFADTEAVIARTDLPPNIVGDTLRNLARRKLIDRFTFADAAGWILTEAGRSRGGELLSEELAKSGARPLLEAIVDAFETGINPRFVRAVTEWQIRSPASGEDRGARIFRELADLADALAELIEELTAHLPRFDRYPRQFAAALEKSTAGDDRWVAGVDRLSCHVVWAELHEDLLCTLGRDRAAGLPQERHR